MNLINDFQKNTNFLNEEFQKLKMVYGANQIPTGMLNKISNSIWGQYKILSSLDKKKTKLNIKIEWAIFTMPHNWVWKMFHTKLWKKVKMELAEREKQQEPAPELEEDNCVDSLMPQVPVDLNALSYPNTLIEDKK